MRRFLLLVCLVPFMAQGQTLRTQWAAQVTEGNVWKEYPRPQMVRPDWTNLNGEWNLELRAPGAVTASYQGKILVPFPIESQLSGVKQSVIPGEVATYSRTFARPKGDRVLLHFGAVDWKAEVSVNGKSVGSHTGGYDPFTFDITKALEGGGPQRITVSVTDPTDKGFQPRGKQVLKPGGIFYTSSTGIWQTVWLEAVPEAYISEIKITTHLRERQVEVEPEIGGKRDGLTVRLEAMRNGKPIAQSGGAAKASLVVPGAALWSPDHPNLYDLRVTLLKQGKPVDSVTSYCAFREVGLTHEAQPRFALNQEPLFLIGPLDQGFWPDGIYTPPSDAAMKYDLEVTKRLGFNMIRKHVKVEPERWYTWCDKLGICVIQDMPSGDKSIGPNDPDIQRSPESQKDFMAELQAMIDTHRNHPCIVVWTPFNEGWGQWNTAGVTRFIKQHDPTRLVDSVTGWADRGVGDFLDYHVYPGPGAPPNQKNRAIFLGEFGGLGLPEPGHMWQDKGWGYQSFKTEKELTDRFVELMADLNLLRAKGLSGAVYTQTTDCETELNGLMTYDRAKIKVDEKRARRAIADLFLPPPRIEPVLPTSEEQGQTWRLTFSAGGRDWPQPGYDDSAWERAAGGFGTPETPGAVVRTRWDTGDIYLRRHFTLSKDQSDLMLRISYDDDVEVYLDGREIYRAPGWTTHYKLVPMPAKLAKGPHVLAIHCHQNQGGQYIDAGLVRLRTK